MWQTVLRKSFDSWLVGVAICVLLGLSSCGTSTPTPDTLDAAALPSLDALLALDKSTFLFKPGTKNCPYDDFDIPPQGYRAQGARGAWRCSHLLTQVCPTPSARPKL
jgi:hypothetical protein